MADDVFRKEAGTNTGDLKKIRKNTSHMSILEQVVYKTLKCYPAVHKETIWAYNPID